MDKADVNFAQINDVVEKLIGLYGRERTYQLLTNSLVSADQVENNEMYINSAIINFCIEGYSLDSKKFKTSTDPKYIMGRASYFKLVKAHTKLSYTFIVSLFEGNVTIDQIRYAIKKMADLIVQPNINLAHSKLHIAVEENINNFINSINSAA